MAVLPLQHDIDYPESDGSPLGETDLHRDEIVDLVYALRQRYLDVPDVYVAGNLFIYTVRGDRSAVICPDVFLVKGVPKGPRRTYRLWEEGQPPALVIEVTSASTRYEDTVEKKEKYARLGVEEYFLFDPLDEYLSPQLQGFRLAGERYWPIELENDVSLNSRVTGLRLQVEDSQRLRLFDLATGQPLPRTEEEAVARRAAERRAGEEAVARRVAEMRAEEEAAARRVAEMRAEEEAVARQVAEAAHRVAERRSDEEAVARQAADRRAEEEAVARQTAESARQAAEERTEREAAARRAAEEEIARLRRELAKRQDALG
jgi:Uma2 family endonuclease